MSSDALQPRQFKMTVEHVPQTQRWGLPALHVRTLDDKGKIIGGLSVHQRQYEGASSPVAHPNVWVKEEHQRKGIATSMYAEVKRRWPNVPIEHSEHASEAAKALNRTLA